MISIAKLDRHVGLMTRMAEALGVDMGEAMVEGRLAPEAYRDAMLRCTHCESPEACALWLKGHPKNSAAAAPGYCRNRALLAELGGR